jgi:hypothetical protein
MVSGILFTGININRVLEFCGDKASFYAELHVDSIKEKRELVVPTDFLFKSSKGNIRVVSWKRFFSLTSNRATLILKFGNYRIHFY